MNLNKSRCDSVDEALHGCQAKEMGEGGGMEGEGNSNIP